MKRINIKNGKNLFFISLAYTAISPAMAEEKDVRVYLPEVVVTSKGQGEDYLQTPARMDEISSSEIETRKPRYVGDVLFLVPGLYVREVNPLVPSIGLRTSANFDTPYFLSALDGIPIVSSVDYNHHSPSHLPVQNACGRIEVLKGAESVLFGSNAMSGVINVVSPSMTEAQEKGNSLSLEVGERDFKRLKVSSGNKIDEKNSYYFSSSYNTDGGWRDLQDGQNLEVYGKHYHKTESGDKITTSVLGNLLRSHVAGYLTKEKFDSNPTESGLSISDPYSDYDFFMLSSRLDSDLGNGLSLVVEPYLRYDQSHMIAFWNTQTTPEDTTKISTLGLKTSLTKQMEKAELSVGVDAESTKFSYTEVQSNSTVVGPVWSPGEMPQGTHYDYDVNYLTVSPFVKGTFFITENLRADVGLRADYSLYDYNNKTKDGDCDSTSNTDGKCGIYLRVSDRKDSFSNVGPKVGMSYQLNSASSVYWNLGQNFKVPNATLLYNLTTSDQSPDLKPEVSTTLEVGYKFEGQHFGLSASAYQMDISDRIVRTQGTLSEMATSVNAGKSRHRGVEVGAAASPISDVRVDVSAGFTDNKFVEYKTGGNNYSGNTESQSPNQVYNVRLTYKPRFLKALSTSLDWKKVGSYWIEDANQNKQDGYSQFNLSANYAVSKTVNLNLRAVNLTDTKYPVDIANYGMLLYRPGMPRTVYAGVEIKF